MTNASNKLKEYTLSGVISFFVFSLLGYLTSLIIGNHKIIQLLNIPQKVLYALIFGSITTTALIIYLIIKKTLLNKKTKLLLDKIKKKYKELNSLTSENEIISCANEIAPLLKFNEQYYINFVQHLHTISLNVSYDLKNNCFMLMKNQIEQAISDLSHNP